MGLVSGKVALVTGSGAGIGRAAALKFAEEGAKVIVSDVNIDGGNETVALVKQKGGNAVFRKSGRGPRCRRRGTDHEGRSNTYGRLDCACNNAGIRRQRCPDHSAVRGQLRSRHDGERQGHVSLSKVRDRTHAQEWERRNCESCLCCRAGRISRLGPYVASKHAINGLTKNAALEYSKQGIRVNSICPGGIETRMLDSLVTQASEGRVSTHEMMDPLHPIGRIGMPNEVAELIVWLCSPLASFVTGANIPVDGGYVAQ